MKKKTKLKDLSMTSVDLVKRGANQEADIKLFKSADTDSDGTVPQGLWKSIQDAVSNWWNGNVRDEAHKEFEVKKSEYMEAIDFSLNTIIEDDTLSNVEKAESAVESIWQFANALSESVMKVFDVPYDRLDSFEHDESGQEEQAEKTRKKGQRGCQKVSGEEGERKMKIDKSKFTAEELKQYQALIAKATVQDETEDEGIDELDLPEPDISDNVDDEEVVVTSKRKPCKKTTEGEEEEMHPAVRKALQRVEAMEKSMEMKELSDIAKKYAPLGEKEDELADTLYELKKSSQKSYDSYIALLDKQLDMVEKSGVFAEIGKSGHGGYAGGDVESKINSIAKDIMKADPNLNRHEAIAKAWDQNPDLIAEYEREYQGGRK